MISNRHRYPITFKHLSYTRSTHFIFKNLQRNFYQNKGFPKENLASGGNDLHKPIKQS